MGRIVVDARWREPTPSQQRFMDARERVVAFLTGYGAGKTSTGAEVALDLAIANRGLDGLIVAPTWGTLHKVTLRAFFDPEAPDDGACPRELIADHNAGKRYFRLVNGSRIYYGSADRPGTLEGQNLAWWWGDEARLFRAAAWRVLIGRLRHAGAKRLQAILTSTPHAGWLQDEFGAEKPDRAAIHGSTRENAKNLAPGFIEDLERTYSKRQCRILIDGEFGLFDGAVYDEYDPKVHLVQWTYNPGLRTVLALDFGKRRPAALFLQMLPAGTPIQPASGPAPLRRALPGTWVVFDELVPDDVTTEQLAIQIKAKGYRVDAIYCDPAGDSDQVALGISDVQVLRSYGFQEIRWQTAPRLRHIPFGIGLVAGLLRNVKDETRLFFAAGLDRPRDQRGVVKDLQAYHYAEPKDGHAVSDEPVKDGVHDHTCLLGSERVWVEGCGWERLDQLDGLRYFRILTPAGLREARVALTRRSAEVFEVLLADGSSVVATGDHRFLVAEPGRGGPAAPSLSWRTVLEVRSLLLAPGNGWREGVSPPGGLGGTPGADPQWSPRSSLERGPFGQPDRKPRGEGADCASLGAYDGGAQGVREAECEDGHRGRQEVALLSRWQGLAPEAWKSGLGVGAVPGIYLPHVWQALHFASAAGRQVLPPQLQDDCAAEASRNPAAQRIIAVREAGVADVWCAGVPAEHAFVLRSGAVSHNCDALRYHAVNVAVLSGQVPQAIAVH